MRNGAINYYPTENGTASPKWFGLLAMLPISPQHAENPDGVIDDSSLRQMGIVQDEFSHFLEGDMSMSVVPLVAHMNNFSKHFEAAEEVTEKFTKVAKDFAIWCIKDSLLATTLLEGVNRLKFPYTTEFHLEPGYYEASFSECKAPSILTLERTSRASFTEKDVLQNIRSLVMLIRYLKTPSPSAAHERWVQSIMKDWFEELARRKSEIGPRFLVTSGGDIVNMRGKEGGLKLKRVDCELADLIKLILGPPSAKDRDALRKIQKIVKESAKDQRNAFGRIQEIVKESAGKEYALIKIQEIVKESAGKDEEDALRKIPEIFEESAKREEAFRPLQEIVKNFWRSHDYIDCDDSTDV